MRTVVGPAAQKDDFYPRKREIAFILDNLFAGNNLQIAAARRVGKTSILLHLKDKPVDGFSFVHLDVERVDSEDAYYKMIYQEILKHDSISKSRKLLEQLRNGTNKFLRNIRGLNLGDGGVEFRESEGINYYDELSDFLSGLDLDGEKLVIMIDEFPEVILNIHGGNEENNKRVIQFLQSNRALRNTDYIKKNVIFIYTGSNSLNITVSRFDASNLINDLNSVPINPLKDAEARDMVTKIFAEYGFTIDDKRLSYFLEKISWLIPFYCQLLIQEIRLMIEAEEEITEDIIDTAFEHIIEMRNKNYFENYLSRLRRIFKDGDYKYAQAILNMIATEDSLTEEKAYDLSQKFELTSHWKKNILECLIYDGYLTNNAVGALVYNSPILKMWWKRYGND